VICGGYTNRVAARKNYSRDVGFVLGLLLNVAGILIVTVMPARLPPPPPGMYAVTCPRCNAEQNVEDAAASYECWQCKSKWTSPRS
jgi:hypothetical protein